MKYRIYKKRILRNLSKTNHRYKLRLCALTFKILPISVIILTAFLLIYISFISIIIINNVQKISLQKNTVALQDKITMLETKILKQKQVLNRENIFVMGFKEAQKIKYLPTNKTVSAIPRNEI